MSKKDSETKNVVDSKNAPGEYNSTYVIAGYTFTDITLNPTHGINDTPFPEPKLL